MFFKTHQDSGFSLRKWGQHKAIARELGCRMSQGFRSGTVKSKMTVRCPDGQGGRGKPQVWSSRGVGVYTRSVSSSVVGLQLCTDGRRLSGDTDRTQGGGARTKGDGALRARLRVHAPTHALDDNLGAPLFEFCLCLYDFVALGKSPHLPYPCNKRMLYPEVFMRIWNDMSQSLPPPSPALGCCP